LPFYRNDGRMGGVIVAALSLDWLAQSIAQKGVPPGAALAIADHNGTIWRAIRITIALSGE
jgi:hypothetical protein